MQQLGYSVLTISEFDKLVSDFYQQNNTGDNTAHESLLAFLQRPDAWLLCHEIVAQSTQNASRFLALQTFSDGARKYWSILDDEQRLYFQNYYLNLNIKWSKEGQSPELLRAANQVLISILKNEWPENWPTFMQEFLSACRCCRNATLNGLLVLMMLSEETHEFADELLTSDRQSEFSRALENDFNLIFSRIEEITSSNIDDVELIKQTLVTLSHYLRWIDLNVIISAPLCRDLVWKLFPNQNFRYEVLMCFDSIAMHLTAAADQNMYQIFDILIKALKLSLGNTDVITDIYNTEKYILQLILTLTHFLLLDQSSLLFGILTDSALIALNWMVQLTMAAPLESFKIVVEFWLSLSKQFFFNQHKITPPHELIIQLQEIFTARMANPPEFEPLFRNNIEFDDSNLYENMRLTLVCFANLSKDNIQNLLVNHLENAQNTEEVLKTSWAIGAISGSLPLEQEKIFISHCFNILTKYIDGTQQEEEKSFFCGCYMFIASVYPRYLFSNPGFLKELMERITLFIQIRYPPLQIMAVHIFKTIVLRCSKVLLNDKEFLAKWLENISRIASITPMEAVPYLYEAISHLIKLNSSEHSAKISMVSQLLVLPLQSWEKSLKELNPSVVTNDQITHNLMFPLHIFSKIILISDFAFYPQIEAVILQSITLYKFYSNEIVQTGSNPNLIKVKSQLLKLYDTFMEVHKTSKLIPELIQLLLNDYTESSPKLRFSQIIDCFSTLIKNHENIPNELIKDLIDKIVFPTFEMIKEEFNTYPDIRLANFRLLSVLLTKVFSSLQMFEINTFSMMLKCLLWGVAHPAHDVSSLALSCVSNLISDIDQNQDSEFRTVFYNQFYFTILFELFSVLTDRTHKFIFSSITRTLQHMFLLIHSHKVILNGNENSEDLLANELTKKLISIYPLQESAALLEFSRALIISSPGYGEFKDLLRNFLIGIKKASPKDHELYSEEILEREINEINGYSGPAEPYVEGDESISEF